MFRRSRPGTVPAGFALAAGAGTLLGIGALAAGTRGAAGPLTVLCLCSLVVLVVGTFGEPATVPPLVLIAWLAVIGFSAPPYAQLRPGTANSARAAIVIPAVGALAWLIGWLQRPRRWPAADLAANPSTPSLLAAARITLKGMEGTPGATGTPRSTVGRLLHAVDGRRQLAAILLAGTMLPLVTIALVAARTDLTIADALLVYLVVVVVITVIGGFWAAIASAVAASFLVNWYFTPPLHTFVVNRAQDLLALVLFVAIASMVSGVVHLAASRAVAANRSQDEATVLSHLAQTVIEGADAPADVLDHLVGKLGGAAVLVERVSQTWEIVARSGQELGSGLAFTVTVRPGLQLRLSSDQPRTEGATRLVTAFGAQAAAALDRQRLRAQASQTEMLAAGNRMRTALLTAVSHDLRTPLASVKAAVSTLRQTDVQWSARDQADLLATIEESADRLDALITNLLDMSRLQTGALDPFIRATALEDIVASALHSLEGAAAVEIDIPDQLPLILADPGLLERVLANLLSNAIRFSPSYQRPLLAAHADAEHVYVCVVDHGVGVAPSDRTQMFAPFQRLGDQNPHTGVGLGLAVAKGLCEAMGGVITAADTRGGGLTMTVRLLRENQPVMALPATPPR